MQSRRFPPGIREEIVAAAEEKLAWAAQTQVAHWMDVIGGWKQMLGADWNKPTRRATRLCPRQNNVLFSVLAQFFGPEAINDRLILIETVSFTTIPRTCWTHDPHHRRPVVGAAFFRDPI